MLEGFPKRLAPRQNNFVSMVPMMPAGRKQRREKAKEEEQRIEDMGQEADQAVTPAPRTPGKTAL